MDVLGGVDFDKGCYIGQEVVSRMKHRGTARKRFFIATLDGDIKGEDRAVILGEKPIGTLGAVYGKQALALLRIDRLGQNDERPTVGDVPITLEPPAYFQTSEV